MNQVALKEASTNSEGWPKEGPGRLRPRLNLGPGQKLSLALVQRYLGQWDLLQNYLKIYGNNLEPLQGLLLINLPNSGIFLSCTVSKNLNFHYLTV